MGLIGVSMISMTYVKISHNVCSMRFCAVSRWCCLSVAVCSAVYNASLPKHGNIGARQRNLHCSGRTLRYRTNLASDDTCKHQKCLRDRQPSL